MSMTNSIISMIFGSSVGEKMKAALFDTLENYKPEVPIHPNHSMRMLWDMFC